MIGTSFMKELIDGNKQVEHMSGVNVLARVHLVFRFERWFGLCPESCI